MKPMERWMKVGLRLLVAGLVLLLVEHRVRAINEPLGCQAVSISSQPVSQTVCVGFSASFSVAATGTGPLYYQWQKNSVNLSNGGSVSGATTANLVLSSLGAGDSSSHFTVVINNVCDSTASSATSTVATLTVSTTDSAGDGIPDCWRLHYFGTTNINSSDCAFCDPEGDGYDNLQEYNFGLNPTNSASYPTNVPPYLAAWWKFDEGSGTITADSSGNGNTGTLVNNPTWVTGVFSNALLFTPASNQEVAVNISGTVTGTFTVAAWVRPEDPTATMTFLSTRAEGASTFDLNLSGGNQIYADIGNGSNWIETAAAATYNYTTGVWYYIDYVVTPTNFSVYANGAYVGGGGYGTSSPVLYDAEYGSPLTIGNLGSGTEQFNGTIDDVRIYDRALSSNDVITLYNTDTVGDGIPNWWRAQYFGNGSTTNSQSCALCDPEGDGYDNLQEYNLGLDPTNSISYPTNVPPDMVLWWTFDEGAGTLSVDASGNAHTAMLRAFGGELPLWTNGLCPGELNFDGRQNFAGTAEPISQTFTACTFACWFKADSLSGQNPAILATVNDNNPVYGKGYLAWFNIFNPSVRPDVGNYVYFGLPGTNIWGSNIGIWISTNALDGEYHHLAGVWDGSQMSLYYDGQLLGTTNAAIGSVQANCYFNVAYQDTNGGCFLGGNIGDVRIYNVALSSTNIAAIFNTDSVGDGIPNWWRQKYFGNGTTTNSQSCATCDPAGDGYSNLQAYNLGLNPTNSASVSTNVPPYMAAWWKFDEGSGSITADSSGNGNTGTLVNNPTWVTGVFSNALLFTPASNQEVLVNMSGAVTGTFTVAAWVLPEDPSATMNIVSTREGGEYQTFDLKLLNGNLIYGDIGNGDNWIATGAGANYTYTTGVWYYIDYVVTPTNFSLYVNGVYVGRGSYGTSSPVLYDSEYGSPLTIGNLGGSGGEQFNGTIDDVRIYDRALSGDDVVALYNTDTVGDGIPNWWRAQYFGTGSTTNSQSCASCDAYGDGFTNLQDFQAGSGPTNPNSSLLTVGPIYSPTVSIQAGVPVVVGPIYSPTVSAQPGVPNVLGPIYSPTVSVAPPCAIIGPQVVATNTVGIVYSASNPDCATYVWAIEGDGVIDGASDAQTVSVDTMDPGAFVLTLTMVDEGGYQSECSTRVIVDGGSSSLIPGGGWWKFRDGAGTTAFDSSGNGNTGMLEGSPPPAWTTNGIGGHALVFDGVQNEVVVANSSTLSPTNVVSLTAWVTTSPGTNGAIVDKWASGGGDGSYRLSLWQGQPVFETFLGGSYASVTSATVIADSNWHNVAGIYDGAQLRVYLDGVVVGVTAATGAIDSVSDALLIGNDPNGMALPGSITDVRVYNRVLTNSEIVAIFNTDTDGDGIPDWWDLEYGLNPLNPNAASEIAPNGVGLTYLEEYLLGDNPLVTYLNQLVGWWAFDETNGLIAVDSSGSGTGGVLTNMNQSDRVLGYVRTGLAFDGATTAVDIPHPATSALASVSNELSIAAWVNMDTNGLNGTRTIFSLGSITNGQVGAGAILSLENGYPTLTITLVSDPYNPMVLASANPLPTNEWHHVLGVYSASHDAMVLYVDGAQVALDDDLDEVDSVLNSGDSYIGALATNGLGQVFSGILDEVRLYNAALSAQTAASLAELNQIVGWWPFDETNGMVAYDYSGEDDNGIMINMMQANRVPGYIGGALQFDGNSTAVDVTNSPISALSTVANELSIAAWVNADTNGVSGLRTIFSLGSVANGQPEAGAILALTNGYPILTVILPSDQMVLTSTNALPTNEWHHVAGTYSASGQSMAVYIDGVPVAASNSLSQAGPALNGGDSYIGALATNGLGQVFSGILDDVRLYRVALSPSDITNLVQVTVPPTTQDPNITGDSQFGDSTDWASITWSGVDTNGNDIGSFTLDTNATPPNVTIPPAVSLRDKCVL